MPRTQTWIPPTTDITLVFPKTDGKFYTDYYTPTLTGNRLSLEDTAQFMKKVDAIRFNPEDSRLEGQVVKYLVLCWFLEYAFAHLFSYLGILNEDQAKTYMWTAIVITFVMGACFNGHIDQKQKEAIQKMVDEQNETLKSKGLRWNLPSEFPAWIELCKDYKNQPANQELASSNSTKTSSQDLEKQAQSQQNLGKVSNVQSQNENYIPLYEEENDK